MKNLRTLLLPAFVLLAGAGTAYATHTSEKNAAVLVDGYVYRPNEVIKCVNTRIKCDTQGEVVCTADVGMGTETLRQLVGTSCSTNLYFPQ